jgi:hypothetical protein
LRIPNNKSRVLQNNTRPFEFWLPDLASNRDLQINSGVAKSVGKVPVFG